LLLANEGYPDQAIAEVLRIGESTVHRTRQKFVESGVEFALREESRAGSKRKLERNWGSVFGGNSVQQPA